MTETKKYQYAIRHKSTGEIHRGPWSLAESLQFMDPQEWDGVDPEQIFTVVRRPVGDWEKFDV